MIIIDKARGAANLVTLSARSHGWRLHPRRLLQSTSRMPIDRPIFLLGVQGGGLTLVSRMLRRHPSVVSVTGNSSYWAGPDETQITMGSYVPSELTGLHHKMPAHPRFPRRDWLYATDELLPKYRHTAADATERMAMRFQQAIRLAVAMHARDPHSARFVDKSQTFTVRLSLVARLLAEYRPRFVLVTRNPYAMCYRAAVVATPLSRLDLSLRERMELAAQHWANSYRCAIADGRAVPALTVRFEDVLHRPEESLRAICSHVELDFRPSMLPAKGDRLPLGSTGSSRGDAKWYPLRTDVNRRYLGRLEDWMVTCVATFAGSLASRWGYTPDGP